MKGKGFPMDLIDQSQVEVDNINHMASLYKKEIPSIVPNGECHFCGEEVEGNKLFCNCKCSQAYDKYRAINR